MVHIYLEDLAGGPLLPYLFILGSDVLTRLIVEEQSNNKISGLPYDGGEQHLVHCLYADDCLLVARVLIKEAEVIADAFDEYCAMSWQKVNRKKSQIIFSTKVHKSHCHFIKRVFLMEEG